MVNNKGISNIACKNVEVSSGCLANFNFTVNPSTKTAQFSDASLGNPNSWIWDFGDQHSATTENASNQYSDNGYYLVSLKTANSATGCSDKTYKLVSIGMNPTGLVAGFGYDADQYNTKADGYPVDFTGTGVGDHARLRWSFGDTTIDDTTSTTPRHYYQYAGSYYVCYYISDPNTGKSDSACEQIQTTTDIKHLDANSSDLVAYPNPLINKTTILFNLKESANVTIILMDISGRKIATLINTFKYSGKNSIIWDASGIENGSYILQMQTSYGNKISKMLVKQ